MSGKEQKKFQLNSILLCTTSISLLLTASVFGMPAIIGFLLPWAVVVFSNFNRFQVLMTKNWKLFLIPMLAAISSVWASDHLWTLKASAELTITIIVAILAAEIIERKTLVSSIMISLASIVLVSVVIGFMNGMTGLGGSQALQGIYESKNSLALLVSILFITSIAIYFDKQQPFIFRAIGFFCFLVSPPVLVMCQSVGAIIAIIFATLIYTTLRFISKFSKSIQLTLVTMVMTFSLFITLLMAFYESDPLAVLNLMGKDSSFTGRTFLWSSAIGFISDNPILGVGYKGFWRVGNPRAEAMWFYSHVPSGSGFNFHNEYLEMWIELGIVGLFIMLGYLAVISSRVKTALMGTVTPDKQFVSLVFIFLLLRTPVEVGLFDQFGLGIILLCLTWIYLKPNSGIVQNKVSLMNFYKNPKTMIRPQWKH